LVGFFVMLTLFNWALIVLTSLVGAGSAAIGINHFVTNGPKWVQVVLFIVVFALGALFQARALRSRKGSRGAARSVALAR
jgi:hypothetical protein